MSQGQDISHSVQFQVQCLEELKYFPLRILNTLFLRQSNVFSLHIHGRLTKFPETGHKNPQIFRDTEARPRYPAHVQFWSINLLQ